MCNLLVFNIFKLIFAQMKKNVLFLRIKFLSGECVCLLAACLIIAHVLSLAL